MQQAAKKRRILFVDDDVRLREGLERGLRGMRHEWDMHFLDGAQAALDLLKREPVDIVVSDMQMPRLDGFQFLGIVKEEYPQTMRVVLSGETGEQVGHRALEVANQCLVKPCGVEDLKTILKQMLDGKERLGKGIAQDALNRLDALPSIPQQYWELKHAIEDPMSSMESVSRVIERDIAMTAKILQLANSAFFGFSSERITSLTRAITMLGLDLVCQLAMVTYVFVEYDRNACPRFSIDALWEEGMKVARIARAIAVHQRAPSTVVESTMLSGLLHGIGKLVLATALPVEYDEYLGECESRSLSLEEELELENERLGTTYPDVGAYTVAVWGLPKEIVRSVGDHLSPKRHLSNEEKRFTEMLAVCAGAIIAKGQVQTNLGRSLSSVLSTMGLGGQLEAWQTISKIGEESKIHG